jgi:uncharacterized protein YjbI with pentapeptide repeats
VRVIEIEVRQERLQLSLSGAEVPEQNIFEPLLQRWIAPLALTSISTIELYGQRDGSDLPFWRCSFSPSAADLNDLESVASAEITPPAAFIDPLEIDFKAPPLPALTEEPLPERLAEAQGSYDSATNASIENPINGEMAPESAGHELAFQQAIESPEAQSQLLPAAVSDEKVKAAKEFLAQYSAGERDFARINLSDADLSGVNLTLANLQGSELIWTNLAGANLYHINLSSAKLRHANLSGATLRSSNLQGTDFLNANLTGADLSWSNLNGANLTGADLTDANLKNAILERVILPDGTLLD